jgi:hypothetical protein
MALYEYENQLADLQNQYAQTQAAQEYGRFVGQQRYSRDKQGLNRNFQQGFPKLTAGFGRRGFGSQVRSGRVGADVADYTNQNLRAQGDLDNEYAAWAGNQQTQQTNGFAAYQGALARLMEQMKAQQAMQSPFAQYQAVNK